MASSLPRLSDRNPPRRDQAGRRPTANVAPCVPTGCTSLSARVIRTRPVMPASSSRARQRPTIPARRAVAVVARAAEEEAGLAAWRLHGIDRGAEDGAAVDVGARVELDLGDEVAPVGRQHLERRLPPLREGACGHLRLGSQADGLDELEPTDDAFLVDPAQKPSRGFGSDADSLGRDGEPDLLVPDARPGRPEQRSGAGSGRVVVDREAQRDLRPPWIQGAFDVVPAVYQRHGANRTLRPVAKVEARIEPREKRARRRAAGDAPDPPFRGEGRGALSRRRAARIPPRRDRPGSVRRRCLPSARGRRRHRLHAPRARSHAGEGDASE